MKKSQILLTLFFVLAVSCRTGETEIQNQYILGETDLVPEGIAYSADQEKFFLTSLAKSKIISIDQKGGGQEDFISSGEYGFMPGAGILADDKNNLLHAVCGYYRSNDSTTSLFTFDLKNGKLAGRYDLQGAHFLNDLIKDDSGNIYITDTKGSAVYLLPAGGENLEVFVESPEIQYPNGIAISEDGSRLFVASHTKGVRIIDIETGAFLNDADTSFHSKGIDGMEYYKGNLYAIQNGVRTNGYNFRKLLLNDRQEKLTGMEVLTDDQEMLNVPLTFCIAGSKAVIIGNSNLQYLDQVNRRISEPDSLKNTRLIVWDLQKYSE